jgi:hypothetical protein
MTVETGKVTVVGWHAVFEEEETVGIGETLEVGRVVDAELEVVAMQVHALEYLLATYVVGTKVGSGLLGP